MVLMTGGEVRRSLLRIAAAAFLAAAVMSESAVSFASTADACDSSTINSLTVTPGDAQVSLSWCQPQYNDPKAHLAYYDVYEGTSPGGEAFDSPAARVTGTSTTVGGLADGTTYYFVVEAFNNFNRAISTSAEQSATPMAAPIYPGAPTRLMASAADSRVRLRWAAPASDGGPPITSYNVYVGTTPGGESLTPAVSATGTSATVTGLTDGSTYYFVVAAVDAAGEGPPSTEASAVPIAAPPASQSPAPPANNVPASGVWLAVILLGAVVLVAAVALAARRLRKGTRPAPAAEPTVRVESVAGPPARVDVQTTGSLPTVTVRFEPHPGVSTTTVEEVHQ
jgi:Fibronectin type III domain